MRFSFFKTSQQAARTKGFQPITTGIEDFNSLLEKLYGMASLFDQALENGTAKERIAFDDFSMEKKKKVDVLTLKLSTQSGEKAVNHFKDFLKVAFTTVRMAKCTIPNSEISKVNIFQNMLVGLIQNAPCVNSNIATEMKKHVFYMMAYEEMRLLYSEGYDALTDECQTNIDLQMQIIGPLAGISIFQQLEEKGSLHEMLKDLPVEALANTVALNESDNGSTDSEQSVISESPKSPIGLGENHIARIDQIFATKILTNEEKKTRLKKYIYETMENWTSDVKTDEKKSERYVTKEAQELERDLTFLKDLYAVNEINIGDCASRARSACDGMIEAARGSVSDSPLAIKELETIQLKRVEAFEAMAEQGQYKYR
jgi:hypothetical protein